MKVKLAEYISYYTNDIRISLDELFEIKQHTPALPHFTLHTLRHTFCTKLAERYMWGIQVIRRYKKIIKNLYIFFSICVLCVNID